MPEKSWSTELGVRKPEVSPVGVEDGEFKEEEAQEVVSVSTLGDHLEEEELVDILGTKNGNVEIDRLQQLGERGDERFEVNMDVNSCRWSLFILFEIIHWNGSIICMILIQEI